MTARTLSQLIRHPVVFLHGWWGGPWVWDPWFQYFQSLGVTCQALDLHGGERPTFDQQLAQVFATVDHLQSPVLIGHSAGGLLAQKVAEQRNLAAVVLLASAPPRGVLSLRSWPLFKSAARHTWTIVSGRPFLPPRREMYRMNLNQLDPDQQQADYDRMVPTSGHEVFRVAVWGVPVDAARVHTPMLVINGSEDRLTVPSLAASIARRYNAAYRQYDGNAHYLMRESNWRDIAADTALWLDQHCVAEQSVTAGPNCDGTDHVTDPS
ncbi:alpha/beta hydrolase [Roseiconus nitratireducens]|uniref:Alpha/beta hydrolase n=1 Tax=Roseiconus nitratireducens TaxID=2605748 RepID=A0A5M6CVZ5_9BACT|nr:alpha/beta hydrolase [Roseiconus nitratireducens]KAA5539401.1 alpha/beta hydrolase [Roseiconus nitratireducens]